MTHGRRGCLRSHELRGKRQAVHRGFGGKRPVRFWIEGVTEPEEESAEELRTKAIDTPTARRPVNLADLPLQFAFNLARTSARKPSGRPGKFSRGNPDGSPDAQMDPLPQTGSI